MYKHFVSFEDGCLPASYGLLEGGEKIDPTPGIDNCVAIGKLIHYLACTVCCLESKSSGCVCMCSS